MRISDWSSDVCAADLRKPEAGEETAAIAGEVAVLKTYALDVSDQDAVKAAVEAVEADLGPIWALVNNAGWDKPSPFLATDKSLWDKIIAINLYGPLFTHAAVAPRMVARGGGRIINIASDAARVGRSEEHTSELQSLMRNSYAVFCLKKNNISTTTNTRHIIHPKCITKYSVTT